MFLPPFPLRSLMFRGHEQILWTKIVNGIVSVSRLTETDRNGPERTETDPPKYRNGLLSVPKLTGTDPGLQWVPKRTGTDFSSYRNELQYGRKGRVGYDMNNPNKSMYVLVCMYVGRKVGR